MVNVVQANIDVGEAEDREGLYTINDHTCIHNNNSNSTGKAQEKKAVLVFKKGRIRQKSSPFVQRFIY